MSKLTHKIYRAFGLTVRDLAGIAISLLLASVVWMIDSLSQRYTRNVTAEIIAESNIPGHKALSNTPQPISARITTTGFNFLAIERTSRKGPIKIFIDQSAFHATINEEFFWIRTDDEAISSKANEIFGEKARTESFGKDSLQFRFAIEHNKKVPVVAMESISYAPQYASITGLEIKPDSILVYGEPSRLAAIEQVYTVPIRHNKLTTPKKGTAKIAKIPGVRTGVDEVSYFIDVDRYVQISQEVTIKAINVPRDVNFSIYPPKTIVDIRTVFPLIESVDTKIELVIDYNDYLSSISGKCVPKLKGKLPLGFFSAEPRIQVFDCISEVK